jgi:hypothetical protein
LTIGELIVPLPSPADILSGRLSLTPALRPLLDLRKELALELDGYTITERLSVNERVAVRRAVWQAVSQVTMDRTVT